MRPKALLHHLAAATVRQLARKQVRVFLQQLPAVFGHERTLAQQAIRPLARGDAEIAGNGKYVPALLQRQPRRDERTALRRGLDHENANGKAAQNTVAHREIAAHWARPRRVFAQEAASRRDLRKQLAVFRWIGDVEPAGQHTNDRLRQVHRALQRHGIDAACTAGHHKPAACGDQAGELLGVQQAVGAAPA